MTLLPKVRLKALPTFPSNIIGGTGLTATKTNGSVTVDMQWNEFGLQSAIPTSPTSDVLTFDSATETYIRIPTSLLGGAVAGIADAPNDGSLYGRGSGAWQIVPGGDGYGVINATTFSGVDPTGVADSTSGLQAWIDYIYVNKRHGRLPAGTYKHTGLTRAGNGFPLVIVGDGPYMTKLVNTSATSSDITLNTSTLGMNSVYIANLTFDASVAKTAGYAIEQTGDRGLTGSSIIENIVIGTNNNAWGGIKITSCLDLIIRDIWIGRVGANGRGISLVGTLGTGFPSVGMVNSVLMQNITIKNGLSGGSVGSGFTTGVYIGNYAVGIQGVNVIVQGGPDHIDYGIWIAANTTDITVSDYIKFENSYADVCLVANLKIDGGGDIAFTDCTFQYNQGSGTNSVTVAGGMNIGFVNCDFHGSLCYGLAINGGSHVRVIGCQFYNNGSNAGGSNNFSDIVLGNTVGAGPVTISGCSFGQVGSTAIAKYNIEIIGPSNTNYVIGPNNYGGYLQAKPVGDSGTVGANAGFAYTWPKAVSLAGTTVTSGTYSSPVLSNPTIQGATQSNGTKITDPPSSFWGLDFTGATIVVNNNSTVDLAPGSGLVVITDPTVTGTTAVYILGGGSGILIQQTGTVFVSNTPTAGKIGIEWNGSTAYRINNKQGNNISFNVAALRTRTTS